MDLREAQGKPCREKALALQSAADEVVRGGEGDCLGTWTTAGTWLASAAFLARLVGRAARVQTLGLKRLLAAAGCEPLRRGHQRGGTGIEQLGVEERAALLDAVHRLMALGEVGLHEALKTSGLTREGWCERGETEAAPLARFGAALPESVHGGSKQQRRGRRSGPRPRHEVRQMMTRLERTAGLRSG